MFPRGEPGRLMRRRRCPAEGTQAAAFVPSHAFLGFWKWGEGRKRAFLVPGWPVERGEKVWSPKLPFAPLEPLCLLSVEANEWWINLGSPLANWDDPPTPPENLPEVCIPLSATETNSHRACRAEVSKVDFFFFSPHTVTKQCRWFWGYFLIFVFWIGGKHFNIHWKAQILFQQHGMESRKCASFFNTFDHLDFIPWKHNLASWGYLGI